MTTQTQTQTQNTDTNILFSGKWFGVRVLESDMSDSCKKCIDILDYTLNPRLGILRMEVRCGARKYDKKIILLSEGAKRILRENLNLSIGVVKTKKGRLKIIAVGEETRNTIGILCVGGSVGGSLEKKNAEIIVSAEVGNKVRVLLIYLENGGSICVKHKKVCIVNKDGIVKIER